MFQSLSINVIFHFHRPHPIYIGVSNMTIFSSLVIIQWLRYSIKFYCDALYGPIVKRWKPNLLLSIAVYARQKRNLLIRSHQGTATSWLFPPPPRIFPARYSFAQKRATHTNTQILSYLRQAISNRQIVNNCLAEALPCSAKCENPKRKETHFRLLQTKWLLLFRKMRKSVLVYKKLMRTSLYVQNEFWNVYWTLQKISQKKTLFFFLSFSSPSFWIQLFIIPLVSISQWVVSLSFFLQHLAAHTIQWSIECKIACTKIVPADFCPNTSPYFIFIVSYFLILGPCEVGYSWLPSAIIFGVENCMHTYTFIRNVSFLPSLKCLTLSRIVDPVEWTSWNERKKNKMK